MDFSKQVKHVILAAVLGVLVFGALVLTFNEANKAKILPSHPRPTVTSTTVVKPGTRTVTYVDRCTGERRTVVVRESPSPSSPKSGRPTPKPSQSKSSSPSPSPPQTCSLTIAGVCLDS